MLETCRSIHKWKLIDVNFDGEPAKAARFPEECKLCTNLEGCAQLVRYAYRLDQFSAAMSLDSDLGA